MTAAKMITSPGCAASPGQINLDARPQPSSATAAVTASAAAPRSGVATSFRYDPADTDLTASVLLQMFDRARRNLAMEVAQEEGAGAGYDSLLVDWPRIIAVEPDAQVTITATLSAVRTSRHQGNYTATASHERERVVVLAQASGWTLTSYRGGDGQPMAPTTCTANARG